MRRRVGLLVTAALLPVGLLPPAAAHAAAEVNLIANPSFESIWYGEPLTGWTCDENTRTHSTSGGSEFTHVGPRDGAAELAAAAPAPAASLLTKAWLDGFPTSSGRAECYQVVPVRPDSTYTLSASVRDGLAFVGSDYGVAWSPATEDWETIATTFHTAPRADTVRIYVHGWYAAEPFQIDDVVLTGPESRTRKPGAASELYAHHATSRTLRLTWTGAAGATRYRIVRDGRIVATVRNTEAVVAGLIPGTTSRYTVVAGNAAGWAAPSAPRTATVLPAYPGPPAQPELDAGCWAGTGVLVTITADEKTTDGYYVYVDGVRAGWLYDIRGVVPAVPLGVHRVEVSALNSAGESPRSEPVMVQVPTPDEG